MFALRRVFPTICDVLPRRGMEQAYTGLQGYTTREHTNTQTQRNSGAVHPPPISDFLGAGSSYG